MHRNLNLLNLHHQCKLPHVYWLPLFDLTGFVDTEQKVVFVTPLNQVYYPSPVCWPNTIHDSSNHNSVVGEFIDGIGVVLTHTAMEYLRWV